MKTLIIVYIILLITPTQSLAQSVTLNIHCWDGYAKHYSNDFKHYISEKYDIDISLNITNVSSPSEFWDLARSGHIDIMSPAHNILKSLRWPFIKNRVAIPINLENIPNYKHLTPFLKNNKFVTNDRGEIFGIPYSMGPYGLAYNADKVKEPDSWNVLWKKESTQKYTISKDYPDANIYISALILGSTYNDLYNAKKLWNSAGKDALRLKLKTLAKNAYSLWEGTASPEDFGKLHYAATWGYAVSAANKNGLNWKMAKPKEGTTMWVDHWVLTSALKNDTQKKLLAEEWINFTLGVKQQTGVIRNWGVSPVITSLGDNITDSERETFSVGEDDYWKSLSLWENQDTRTTNSNSVFWQEATAYRNKK